MRWTARALGLLVLASLAWTVRELRLQAFASHLGSQRYQDIYYLPPANWLPLLSLGFRDALADLIWCRSLVYFGEELGQRGAVKFVFDYTDAVIALDPDFKHAYRWAAVAAVSRPVDFSFAESMRGGSYLKRAIERWPGDGELHWEYGALLRFEVAPMLPPGKEKERLLGLAAPHLTIASRLGAGPPWLALNSATLLERLGQTEQAIRHLEEVFGTVQDERTKREIAARLAALRSQAFVEALHTANAQFERSRTENFPYLSPGLFMLLGPRVDTQWLDLVAHRYLPAAQEPSEAAEPDEEAQAAAPAAGPGDHD
jgi:hypothetical protein